MIGILLCRLLYLYLIVVFARVLLSWFPIAPGSGLASVYNFLHAVTEPVLGPLRRLIPPIGGAGMAFDLSPIIVFMAITLLLSTICG